MEEMARRFLGSLPVRDSDSVAWECCRLGWIRQRADGWTVRL